MRNLILLLGIFCCLLCNCMTRPASQEIPHLELVTTVKADHIFLQVQLRSRSNRPVVIVDHEDFVTWRVESASSAGKVTACGIKPWQRAEWNQVKVLLEDRPLVLEKSISYHRQQDGWMLSNATGARNQLDYLTYGRKLKVTFLYSVDRSSLPRFWWLSQKGFMATPLTATQYFSLNP